MPLVLSSWCRYVCMQDRSHRFGALGRFGGLQGGLKSEVTVALMTSLCCSRADGTLRKPEPSSLGKQQACSSD